MIPKVIHYCWFGGQPLPELAQKCITSWRKYCPDYEIREWNEQNFDLDYCPYVREAYEEKKWAFVTDVVRLYALVNEGGIYMDTDVEVVKPLDDLLEYEAVSGFENVGDIPTGLMASEAHQPLFQELLDEYDGIHFRQPDGSLDCKTNVVRITEACEKYGLRKDGTFQTVHGFTLLPKECLCPKDYRTGEIHLTENTYTIHHFSGSWLTDEQKLENELRLQYLKHLPLSLAGHAAKFIAIKRKRGIRAAMGEMADWLRRKL